MIVDPQFQKRQDMVCDERVRIHGVHPQFEAVERCPPLLSGARVHALTKLLGALIHPAASGTLAVSPLLPSQHHSSYRAVACCMLGKPSSSALRSFFEGNLGGPPFNVIPSFFRDIMFLCPVLFHCFCTGSFMDRLLVEQGEFLAQYLDGPWLMFELMVRQHAGVSLPPVTFH